MALLPYNSNVKSPNSGRSASCSSPIRKQIVYREIYSIGDNTLVRSFSCNHVFDKDVSGQTFQTTQIQVSSFLTPEKNKCADVNVNNETDADMKQLQQTPKTQKNSDKQIQKNSGGITQKSNSRKKKLKTNSESKPVKGFLKRAMSVFIVPLIISYILYNYVTNMECDYVWDVKGTIHELKENLFGQDDAVARISSVLFRSNGSSDFLTMVFTGGVGVGKTYSSSIISHNFPWSSNKQLTYSDSFDLQVQSVFKSGLSKCGCNLVIVDDLSVNNLNDVMRLVAHLNDKRQGNENVLIILIFQVHSDSERHDIIKEFKESYITFYNVPFKSLTKDSVEKCYLAEMERQQISVPLSEVSKLVEEKMKRIEIAKGLVGCKGVAEDVSSYSKRK